MQLLLCKFHFENRAICSDLLAEESGPLLLTPRNFCVWSHKQPRLGFAIISSDRVPADDQIGRAHCSKWAVKTGSYATV